MPNILSIITDGREKIFIGFQDYCESITEIKSLIKLFENHSCHINVTEK